MITSVKTNSTKSDAEPPAFVDSAQQQGRLGAELPRGLSQLSTAMDRPNEYRKIDAEIGQSSGISLKSKLIYILLISTTIAYSFYNGIPAKWVDKIRADFAQP